MAPVATLAEGDLMKPTLVIDGAFREGGLIAAGGDTVGHGVSG
jgi:hypothetical protein